MLALIRNSSIIGHYAEGGWVDLPNGDRVSPAVAGWVNKGLSLATIVLADPVPPGNRVQSTSVEMVNGNPKYVNVVVADPLSLDDYKLAFDLHLDAVAQQRRYNSSLSIVSYIDDDNAMWAAEAQAFKSWRGLALASMFDQLHAVETGGDAPSVEMFIDALPVIDWP